MNNNFTNNLIYENKNALSSELCENIISLYNKNTDNHCDGRTLGGVNKHIKDTTDMNIPNDFTNEQNMVWVKIEETLQTVLQENLKIYIENLSSPKMDNYKILGTSQLHIDHFMIQKYNKLIGKYIYHDDFCDDTIKKRYRVLTYLWYLNTVEEGGHTEFFGNYLIKPEQGKLLLFPSSWTFPHCGKVPLSHDKYIITGWLYTESNF
jgi:hypothetical protein